MNSLLGRLRKALGALRAARGGNVTITFALAVIPVVGFTGAAVDYSRGNSVKAALQAAADAGALYAAKADYPSDDARVTAGVNSFNANYASKLATASPTVTVGGGTVTVTATGNVASTFLKVLGIDTVAVSVTAVARIGGASACVLALQTSDDAIFVHGSASLKANCGVYSNSAGSNGIDFDGNSVTKATSICVVGNYVQDSQAQVSPKPQVRCPAMPDPLASLPVPTNASAGCTYNGYEVNDIGTLNPGVYCGGIKIGSSAQATFNPGIYVIRDGQFNIGSSAHVTGQNVMFYLTGQDANLDWGSSSYINVTAPTTGTYKGVVFFQSRTANTSNNRFGGSGTSIIQGAVYFPNGTAEINCNGSVMASADYTVWVVKRLQLDSSASLQVNSNYGGSSTPLADGVSAMVYGQPPTLIK